MKRLTAAIVLLLIISMMPKAAVAAVSDWMNIPVPASDGDANPVFFDTNTYLASDITVDVNDNLYVMSGSRIIRFTPDGHVDESWGNNGMIYDDSMQSSNAEQLAIVADSRGYVYAHCRICEDGSPTFIKRYTPDGKADVSWYSDGIMGGKLVDYYIDDDDKEPQGGIRNQDEIVLDSKDNLYVLYDREVYRFLPDGTPDSGWQELKLEQPPSVYDDGGDGVWFANSVKIDWQDNIYIFNGYDQTVAKYNENGRLIWSGKCPLYYPSDYDETQYLINQVAFDLEGNIYTNDDDADTISKYSTDFQLLTDWRENGLLSVHSFEDQYIDDFISDTKGNLYILDMDKATVSKYTSEGEIDVGWGSQGNLGNVNGSGEPMLCVNDVLFDNEGNIYIVDQKDYESPTLYKLDAQFKIINGWSAETDDASTKWEFGFASSVCVQGGYIYVEQGNTDVRVWESKLIRLDSDGKQDSGWEIITNGFIHSIITDAKGCLYIADSNYMINRYTPDGEIDNTWVSGGIQADGFVTGIAIDCNDYLYVCVGEHNRITRYTPQGIRDSEWGNNGDIDIPDSGGWDEYYDISSIAVDDACNLYISDITSNRILRYDSSGQPDTSWCDNGTWKSADDLSNALVPMINPTRIKIYGGKLYTVWNNMLYVMSDSAANLGVKNESETMASVTAAPAATETTVNADVDNKMAHNWWWVIGAGALIISLAAVFAVYRISKKKRR